MSHQHSLRVKLALVINSMQYCSNSFFLLIFPSQERRAAIVRQNKALNQQVAKIEVPVSD